MAMHESSVSSRLRAHYRALVVWVNAVHAPDYLAAKAEDFRVFTRVALLITAVFLVFTIIWDYAIDPVNAGRAVWLRLTECAAALVWRAASWKHLHSATSRAATLIFPLVVSATFIAILGLLDNGPAYGVGGFLYFFIFVPFLVAGQPFSFAVLVLTVISIFPMAVAPLGLSAGLNWAVYNAYVWIGFAPIVAILVLCEYLYWRVFVYRGQVETLAVTDGLTGLANRRYFIVEGARILEGHKRGNRQASLLFIDIDRFKRINDTYGHAVGDAALRHVVETLEPFMRKSDLMARYGGEEFVVLLPDTTDNAAFSMADRMRVALRERPFNGVRADDSQPLVLTISVGVASYRPEAGTPADIDLLIHAADHALYRAKNDGRDRVARTGTQGYPQPLESGRPHA